MTTRSFTRRCVESALIALASVALVGAATPPSGASPPQHIDVEESGTFLFPLCGVETLVQFHDFGTLMIRERGAAGIEYYTDRLSREVTNTNVATGTSVRLTQTYRGRDQRIVDNGDGTLTVIFRVTYNEIDYAPDGSVAFRAAGQDTVRVVVDHNGTPGDSSDDSVMSEDYLGFTGHNSREGIDFCDWYLDVTG